MTIDKVTKILLVPVIAFIAFGCRETPKNETNVIQQRSPNVLSRELASGAVGNATALLSFGNRLEGDFVNGNWGGIFDSLGTGYKSRIRRDLFLQIIAESGLRVDNLEIVKIVTYGNGGYMLCSVDFNSNTTDRISSASVIFVSLEDDEWKIDNLPFPEIPSIEFLIVPQALTGGLYKGRENTSGR